MGALFSSTPDPVPQTPSPVITHRGGYSQHQTPRQNNTFYENRHQNYTWQPATGETYPRPASAGQHNRYQINSRQEIPKPIHTTWVVNPLNPVVLTKPIANKWVPHDNATVLSGVLQGSVEYNEVSTLFKSTTQRHFKVVEIQRVQNKYLLGCYMLKMEEMKSRHGVQEIKVFHGTTDDKINSICLNNFNWRLIKQHKFGQGVSFSPISNYASHYSEANSVVRKMFLVRMLVQNIINGNENMIIPPLMHYSNINYDTAQKPNGQVYVKFSDNEFYPEYIIHYTGKSQKNHQKNNHNNNNRYVNYEDGYY